MADEGSDEEDFEDLFSFGASTTEAAQSSSESAQASQPPTSNGSDFESPNDVSLSTTTGGAPPPSLSAGSSVPSTPGGPSAAGAGTGGGASDDEFDDLFGAPPPVTDTTTTNPNNNAIMGERQPESLSGMDSDFHVHDEDTRDMLDWLGDDDAAATTAGKSKTQNDDFDFDEMIAESSQSSGKNNDNDSREQVGGGSPPETDKQTIRSSSSSEGEPQIAEVSSSQDGETTTPSERNNTKIGKPTTDGKKSSNVVDDPDGDSISMVPSNIEDELSLDQWEDDDQDTISADGGGGAASDGKSSPKSPPRKKISFSSLSEAIRSNASTVEDVRSLYFRRGKEGLGDDVGVGDEERARLWTKVLCNKILEDVEEGSLADSFREWEKKRKNGEIISDAAKVRGNEEEDDHGAEVMIDALLKQASCGTAEEDDEAEKRRQLLSLWYFHSRNNGKSAASAPSSSSSRPGVVDPLVLPVALAILRARVPSDTGAASVVLSQIEPSAMPLLRFYGGERYLATKALHADFYLLACYHLPLLVMHLDSHCPGWYWPRKGSIGHREDDTPVDGNGGDKKLVDEDKKLVDEDNAAVTNEGEKEGQESSADEEKAQIKEVESEEAESNPEKKKESKLEDNGLVPLSWFVTTFAGECGGSCLDHKHLLPLWDNVLTKGDHSWKFFLAVAVIEKHSDILLMSRGENLKRGLEKILDFQVTSSLFAEESFVGASSEGTSTADADDGDEMVSEWLSSAKSLVESTPSSVIELLRSADDRAVAAALKVRQTQVEKELQAQLDAEEAARSEERKERDREADRLLDKARLTAYYRTHNPTKIDTVDNILKLFDGRMGVLNEKLKKKYGKGFIPDEAPENEIRSFILSVNQSITETRKNVSVAVAERRKKTPKSASERSGIRTAPVALEVSATEVIPAICTTKANKMGKKTIPARRTSNTAEALQFYLVDCRHESTAREQGRFPTAVTLSPEKLQDPDELQKLTEMFESFRGAVHICVMGEGFASFPVLYNHSLSKAEEKLLEGDLARTGDCALFFLKKGFPFVSVLKGGFAAAHAFLSRNGPPMGMSPPEVLVDYDPDVSLFAQLETARQEEDHYKNAPAREKTARSLQKIIDNSMTRLTIEEKRINDLANDLAKPETVVKMKQSVSNFLAKPKTVPSISFGTPSPLFMTKAFASTKKEGESEKKIEEPTQKGDKAKSVTSFTEKINFKLPSFYLSSSGTAVDEKENDTESGLETSPDSGETTSNNGKVGDSASVNSSKISSAFSSFTQRMHQSSVTVATATDGDVPALEGDPATKENAGSKMSFSSFANRIKQVPSEETEDSALEMGSATTASSDKEKDGGVVSEGPSKMSTAFASLTQRMQHTTATVSLASASEGDPNKKESPVSKMTFPGFTNRIKIGQQSAGQPTILSHEAGEDTSEKTKLSTPEKKGIALASLWSPEESSLHSRAQNSEEETKTGGTTDNAAKGGRFTKFTQSIGGTLTGLRETGAEVKGSEENDDSIPEKSVEKSTEEERKTGNSTDGSADGGRFTKFTNPFSGTLAGFRETVAKDNARDRAARDTAAAAAAAADAASDANDGSIPVTSGGEKLKAGGSTDNPTERFTKFTKSIGGTLAGLRDTAADDKVSEEIKDSIPQKIENEEVKAVTSTDKPADGGKFTKFTKSIGGGLTGLRFPKADFIHPKKSSDEGQPDSMANALASLGKVFEEEPLPKTRFQRHAEEEVISFDEGGDEATASNADLQDGDESNEDVFADVSLTDGDGEKPDGDEEI